MNNKRIIFFLFFVILITASFFFALKNKKNKTDKKNLIIPTENLIPTISSKVKVNLSYINHKKEVLLSISNIPPKTSTIEYLITYETEEGGLQGVNGIIEVQGSSFEKKVTLGTCSSGTCVYHRVKGKIKLELTFKGGYGQTYFNRYY